MGRTERSSTIIGLRIRPWHRVVAALVLLGSAVAAVFVMLGVEDDRTSWSQHLAGALFVLLVPGAIAALVLAPRPAARVLVLVWWTLPLAAIWVGVEHWLNWFAFYDTTGRSKITSETGARVRGSFVVVLGVFGLATWAGELKRRRRTGPR